MQSATRFFYKRKAKFLRLKYVPLYHFSAGVKVLAWNDKEYLRNFYARKQKNS